MRRQDGFAVYYSDASAQVILVENPPGQAGYTPLRALQFVSWKQPQRARELRSAGEVKQALTQGEIEIKQPGVVINMPMITWPDGHR